MDKRRLQADIDRTIKKVAEGRQIFQDTLTKFEQAATQIQREKFEADLKKEIKKLQRFRDQIKTWLTSNDIKDKKGLSDARKEIEMDMERFKVIERETKTKAYSKEGLGLEVKKDPLQKEKEEWEEWFKHIIAELNIAVEKIEFDIESSQSTAKKKRNDRDKTAAMDARRGKLEEIRSHIVWCEVCMRALDNDNLDLGKLKHHKDDIEYYCSQPSEYDLELHTYNDLIIDHNKLVDEAFNLSNRELSQSNSDISSLGDREPLTQEVENNKSFSGGKNRSADNNRQRHKSLDDRSTGQVETTVKGNALLSSTTKANHASSNKISIATSVTPISLSTCFPDPVISPAVSTNGFSKAKPLPIPVVQEKKDALSLPASVVSSEVMPQSVQRSDDIVNGAFKTNEGELPNTIVPAVSDSSATVDVAHVSPTYSQKVHDSNGFHDSNILPMEDSVDLLHPSVDNAALGSMEEFASLIQRKLNLGQSILDAEGSTATNSNSLSYPHVSRQTSYPLSMPSQAKERASPLLPYSTSGMPVQPTYSRFPSANSALPLNASRYSGRMPPFESSYPYTNLTQPSVLNSDTFPITAPSIALGRPIARLFQQPTTTFTSLSFENVDILAPFRNKSVSSEQMMSASQLLELGHRRCTRSQDSNRARMTLLKIPPSYETQYPKEVADYNSTEEYYSKLDASTLFFIFYYFEGSKAQFLASKALKKKSWRFHKKELLWFQRLEEPKSIDEECECGTYVYWDPETKSQKKRENFTFEYRFLEDSDLT